MGQTTRPAGQRAFFYAYHERPLEEAQLLDVMRHCGPTVDPLGRPIVDDDRRHRLRVAKRYEYNRPIDFEYPDGRPGAAPGAGVRVYFALRQIPYELYPGQVYDPPALAAARDRWLAVKSPSSGLELASLEDASWYLSRCRCVVPLLRPPFAFGDLAGFTTQYIGEEPRRMAWPVLVYGPELVDQHGREQLLGAPVWRAEELAYGGVWLQVLENPFVAKAADLRPLAEHLGLEVPR